jgi:hypothetical protein
LILRFQLKECSLNASQLLLNEMQQQAAEIRDLKKLVMEMEAGLAKLQAKHELVARR